MPIYQIGYGTCEESEYWEFEHDDVFTAEDLKQIVEDCLFEVMDIEAGKFDSGGLHNSLFISDNGPSLQYLMGEKSFKCLLKDRGFRPVHYQAAFSTFGWASAITPGDWGSNCGDEVNDLQERLKARIENAGIYVESYKKNGGKNTYHRLNRRK